MENNGKSMRKALAALALHPKCGAFCRTTGKACLGYAMSNGRCRMHGGKSTGRPTIHGRDTKAAMKLRRDVRDVLRALKEIA